MKAKRILSAILCIAMVLSTMSFTAFAADSITEALDFTAMETNNSGAGWAWDASTKILTLDGLNLSVTDGHAIIVPDGTKIVLAAGSENTIVTNVTNGTKSDGIFAKGNLTIESEENGELGTLNITTPHRGIEYYLESETPAGASFTFSNIKLNITGDRGVVVFYKDAVTDGADVSVSMTGVEYTHIYNGSTNKPRTLQVWTTAGDATLNINDGIIVNGSGDVVVHAGGDSSGTSMNVTDSTLIAGAYFQKGGGIAMEGGTSCNAAFNNSHITAIADGLSAFIMHTGTADEGTPGTMTAENSTFFIADPHEVSEHLISAASNNTTYVHFADKVNYEAVATDDLKIPANSTIESDKTKYTVVNAAVMTVDRETGVLTIPAGTVLKDNYGEEFTVGEGGFTLAPGGALPAPVPKGNTSMGYLNENETRITGAITNANPKDSVVLELYSGDTKIATTTLVNKNYLANAKNELTWSFCITDTSSSWNTVWEQGNPRSDMQPDKVILYIDGVNVAETAATMWHNADGESGFRYPGTDSNVRDTEAVWASLGGVNAAATIDGTPYASLEAAIAAAEEGNTIVLAGGTHTMPGTVANKNITVKGTGKENTVLEMLNAVTATDSTIAFENLTAKFDNDNYEGLQHSAKVTYTDCIHIGTEFLYAEEVVYKNCEFNIEGDAYAVWTYGSEDVTFDGCEFNTDGKAVLVYREAAHTAAINVENCEFNATTNRGKAAIEVGQSANGNKANYNLNITESKANTNFVSNNSSSNLWGNKNDMDFDGLKMHVDGQAVNNVGDVGTAFFADEAARLTSDLTAGTTGSELKVKLYSRDTLIAETELIADEYKNMIPGELTWSLWMENKEADAWKTTWVEGYPNDSYAPTRVELWIDGIKLSEGNINMFDVANYAQTYEWKDVPGVARRTIKAVPSIETAEANDEFTVDVKIDGTELIGAEWTLIFDSSKVTYIGDKEFDGNKIVDENYLTSGVYAENEVVATYKFKVNADENIIGDAIFDIEESIAWTTIEAGHNVVVETEVEKGKVQIGYAALNPATVSVDNNTVDTESESIFYDGKQHTVVITADEGVDVAVTVNGEAAGASNTFTEEDVYVIEYTISKPGYTPITKTFTLNITGPDFVVEVNTNNETEADYRAGKKLVLVYTDTDDVHFTYNGITMIDVTTQGYLYENKTGYKHVFGYVADAIENGELEDYKANVDNVNTAIAEDYTLKYTREDKILHYDLNFSDELDLRDVSMGYYVYNGEEYYYINLMKSVLKADVNADKRVNGADTGAIVNAYNEK